MIYLYYLYQNNVIMYVGLTSDPITRKKDHKEKKPSHVFTIVAEYDDIQTASLMEEKLIADYNTYRDFSKWNKSPGGDYKTNSGYDRTGIGGAPKGTIPWNKGLSKDDPRVAAYIQESVSTRKKNGYNAWNKGKPNPLAALNGKKSSSKQSKTVTGRKRKYREDGTWYWIYPSSL